MMPMFSDDRIPHKMPFSSSHEGAMGRMAQANMSNFSLRPLDEQCYRMPCPMPPTRSMVHGFLYLTAGEVLVEVGDRTHLVRPYECIMIPAGQLFSVKYYKQSRGYMGGFRTELFEGEALGSNVLQKFDFLRVWGSSKIRVEASRREILAVLLARLTAIAQAGEEANQTTLLCAYLITFLVEMDDLYRRESLPEPLPSDTLCNRFIEAVFDPQKPRCSVAEYAIQLHVTANHLAKMVTKTTGKSPMAWIEEAMMLEAKLLLRNTELSISEVSEKIGVWDQSYFSRRFRQHEGMTPSAYRKRNKKS